MHDEFQRDAFLALHAVKTADICVYGILDVIARFIVCKNSVASPHQRFIILSRACILIIITVNTEREYQMREIRIMKFLNALAYNSYTYVIRSKVSQKKLNFIQIEFVSNDRL